MKALRVLVTTTALFAAGAAMADEAVVHDSYAFDKNQLIPVGARAEVGTTGYGGALLWQANPYVGLALGYNGGDISWSDDLKVNGSKYDLDMDNKTAYLNAEIRPWGTSANNFVNSLYVATGVGYLDNDYALDRRVSQGRNFTVNNTDFNATSDVHIAGKMRYKDDIAPYVGVGIAPQVYKNIGVFGEVGAYYTGNPTATLQNVNGGTASNGSGANLDDEIAKEQANIRDKSRYEWMPVAKVGVSFKF